MDLDFSLWEVLNYSFVALNRYRAIEIFYFSLRQFVKLCLQGLCPFHVCCRIYQYKVVHMYPSFNIFRVCTKVPSLIPDTGNLSFLFFFPWAVYRSYWFFSKNQFCWTDFSPLFAHLLFHLFPLSSFFFLLLTLDLICSSSFLEVEAQIIDFSFLHF